MDAQAQETLSTTDVPEWTFSGKKDTQTTYTIWNVASAHNIRSVAIKHITNVLTKKDGTLISGNRPIRIYLGARETSISMPY